MINVHALETFSDLEIRELIVEQLGSPENPFVQMIDSDYESNDDWKIKMKQNAVFCDETFQQLAADYFKLDIILICVYPEDGHNENGLIVVKCNFPTENSPIHLLYYNETRFAAGHFQSIVRYDTVICDSNLTHSMSSDSALFQKEERRRFGISQRKRKSEEQSILEEALEKSRKSEFENDMRLAIHLSQSDQHPTYSNLNQKPSFNHPEIQVKVKARLDELGFMLSPTDPETKADGNCFVYCLMDQLK